MLSASNLFAQFVGIVNPGDVEHIPINVAPKKLGITGDKVLLGFQTQSQTGSSFDPSAVQIHAADGSLVTPQFATDDLAGTTDSVTIAELGQGTYTLDVSGTVTTRSQYETGIFLVGDVDGDHVVTQNDLDAIRQSYGAQAGSANYRLAADANLDGRINALDLSLARRNQVASQPVSNQFALFTGTLSRPGDVQRIPLHIALDSLGITADQALVGIQVQSRGGGGLDATVQVRDSRGQLVTPAYTMADSPGSANNVVIAPLGTGNYTLEVSGALAPGSKFQANVYLVGDVDGDRWVSQGDLDAIRQMYGSQMGDAKYQLAADANLDGRINAIDLALARRNLAASQPVLSGSVANAVSVNLTAAASTVSAPSSSATTTSTWGGVYDRVTAVTPTAGYKEDAAMQLFDSQDGWVQPLASATSPQGGVLYAAEDSTVDINWFYRSASYGNSLVVYQVDDADGNITIGDTTYAPGDSGYAGAAAQRKLIEMDSPDGGAHATELPPNHLLSLDLAAGTYISYYVIQGADGNADAPHWHWFPFADANDDDYQHFQDVESDDPLYVPGATSYKVEDLSPSSHNAGGYVNDADFNDVVFSVDFEPHMALSGASTINEGSQYTLSLGEVVDPDQGDAVTGYTIRWGDGCADTYTPAQIDDLGRQLTHLYMNGPATPTITVDLTDNDGVHTDAGSLSIAVVTFPTLTAFPESAALTQSDANSVVHLEDPSGELPAIMGYGTSYVGDDCVLSGNVTFSSQSELGFFARGDAEGQGGYVLAINPTDSSLDLRMMTADGTVVDLDSASTPAIDPNGTYQLTFELHGSELSGKLYAADGTLLAPVTATDDTYSTGYVGTWAAQTAAAEPITGDWSNLHLSSSLVALSGASSVDEGSLYQLNLNDLSGGRVVGSMVNWGDGSRDVYGSLGQKTHYYPDGLAVYTISVGLVGADGTYLPGGSLRVTVNNVAPTLAVTGDKTVSARKALTLTDLGTFTDPGFNNPQGNPPSTETFTYTINWGDGTTPSTGTAAIDGEGCAGVRTHGSFDGSHTYASAGKYVVSVTVADDDGGRDTKYFNVAVDFDDINEGSTYTLPLSYGGLSGITGWSIDWGDGNIQSVSGTPASVTHVYADGPRQYNVVATMTGGGGLDPTFGNGGRVATPIDSLGDQHYRSNANVAVQPDGKIVVRAGSGVPEEQGSLLRYNPDGSLDTAFGDNGVVTTDPGDDRYDGTSRSGLALQPDGKILVSLSYTDSARGINGGDACHAGLERYNTDGTPDLTFGQNGKIWLPTLPGDESLLQDIVVRPDGRILVATTYVNGGTEGGDVLFCFTGNGNLDTSFGQDGVVYPDCNASEFRQKMLLQPDGKIVVAGMYFIEDSGDPNLGQAGIGLTRYNVNGTLDTTFGNGGEVETLPGCGMIPEPVGIDLRPDGRIVVTGHLVGGGGGPEAIDTVILCYKHDGSLDPDFGTAGVATTSFSRLSGSVATVSPWYTEMQSDGKLILIGTKEAVLEGRGGYYTDNFVLCRLNIDGSLDETFGTDGVVVTTFGDLSTYPIADSIAIMSIPYAAIEPDGTLLVAGWVSGGGWTSCNVVLTRYLVGATVSRKVSVHNVAPTLTVVADQTVDEGQTLHLTNLGQFTDPGFDNPLGDPPTRETFTYTINWGDGTTPSSGDATIDAEGHAGVVLTCGSFDGTHTYLQAGWYTVTVTVRDDDGGTATKTFRVHTVGLRPPYFTSTPIVDAYVGTTYHYESTASDPDNDRLTFYLPADQIVWPNGFTPTAAEQFGFTDQATQIPGGWDDRGIVTWNPPAELVGKTVTICEVVTDTTGNRVFRTFQILIHAAPGNHNPMIVSEAPTSFDILRVTQPQITGGTITHTTDPTLGAVEGQAWLDVNGDGTRAQQSGLPSWIQLATPGDPVAFYGDRATPDGSQNNDDGSSLLLNLGFTFDFFGNSYTQFYINNNGNITFAGSLSEFKPTGFPQASSRPMIAPFWADVDTRGANSGVVHLATGTSPRGNAFVQVDWQNVGYFDALAPTHDSKTNDFTLYIEDDPDGDLVAFIYRNMAWTTGDVDSPSRDGFGSTGAQIGFDAGDGNYQSYGVTGGKIVKDGARPNSAGTIAAFSNQVILFRIDASGNPLLFTEPGIDGCLVQLVDAATGNVVDQQLSQTLDMNGDGRINPYTEIGLYRFENVTPGDYQIRVVPQTGWQQTDPTAPMTREVVVTAGNVLSGDQYDFGVAHHYFYAVDAVDPDGDTLQYQLTSDLAGAHIDPATGVIDAFPTAAGTYQFTVSVSDGRGGSAVQQFTLTVADDNTDYAPQITSTPPPAGATEHNYTYRVRAFDANFDPLTFSLSEHPGGMEIDPLTGVINWTPASNNVGVDNWVTVVVRDPRGMSDEQRFDVQVTQSPIDQPPQFLSSPALTAVAGSTYEYQVNATDPEGDSFTVSLSAGPSGMAVKDYVDLVWQPTDADIGPHNVVLVARDDHGGISSQSFTVNVIPADQAPKITSRAWGPAAVGRQWSYQIVATDPNGDSLTYEMPESCWQMGMNLTQDGLLTWTPTAVGNYEVAVRVDDGRGGYDVQGFILSVDLTAPPRIVDNIPRVWIAGQSRQVQFTVTDEDPITDLVDAVSLDNGSLCEGLSVTPPLSGTQVGDHYEYVYALSWTPPYTGPYTWPVHILALNDAMQYSRLEVDLQVVPQINPSQPPVISSTPAGPAVVGETWQYQLAGTDPDGGDSPQLTFSVSDFEVNGRRSTNYDFENNVLQWTPQSGDEGTAHIEITLTDGTGVSTTQAFDLAVVDEVSTAGPQFTTVPTGPAVVNQTWTYKAQATDPNSLPLDYELVPGQYPDSMHLQVVDGYAEITWVPSQASDPSTNGYLVSIKAREVGGLNDITQSFYLPVVVAPPANDPPQFLTQSLGPMTKDCPFKFQLDVEDPNGNAISSIEILPDGSTPAWYTGASIDTAGHLQLTPTRGGNFQLTLKATDEYGASSTVVYPITVLDNAPPSFQYGYVSPAFLGQTFTYSLKVKDPNPGDQVTVTLDTAVHMTQTLVPDIQPGVWDLTLTWDVPANFPGPYPATVPVRILASDNHGAQAAPLCFNLPLYDPSDPNSPTPVPPNSTLQIPANRQFRYQIDVQNPHATALTFTLDTAGGDSPAGLTVTSGGAVEWTPTLDEVSATPYNIQVLVDDGVPGSTIPPLDMSILVVLPTDYTPTPPAIDSVAPTGATAGQQLAYEPHANGGAGGGLQWFLDTAPDGMTIDKNTGRITWTPPSSLVGQTVDVELRVIDATNAGDIQRFTLTIGGVNQPPTINVTFPGTCKARTPFAFDVLASDPEGHALTYQLLDASKTPVPGDSPISINQQGHIQWADPGVGHYIYFVRVAEKDCPSSFSDQLLSLDVIDGDVHVEPIIVGSPNGRYATVGQPFAYQFNVLDLNSGNQGFTWAIAAGASGDMAIDANGRFTWTPANTDAPSGPTAHTVKVAVTNRPISSTPATTYLTFTLTAVVNDPPQVVAESTLQAVAGTLFTHQVKATDSDGGPLGFAIDRSAGNLPAETEMTIDPSGILWWRVPHDAGTATVYTVPVVVTDRYGAKTTQCFTLQASPTDTVAPTISAHIVDADGNIIAPGTDLDVHGTYRVAVTISDNVDQNDGDIGTITVVDVAMHELPYDYHPAEMNLGYGYTLVSFTYGPDGIPGTEDDGLNQGNVHFEITATDAAGNTAKCEMTYYAADPTETPAAKIEEFRSGIQDLTGVDLQAPITSPVDVFGVANMADPDAAETGQDYYSYRLILYRADSDFCAAEPEVDPQGNHVLDSNGHQVYALVSQPDYVILAGGDKYLAANSSAERNLGTLDPTLYSSGMYRLVLAIICNCGGHHYKAVDERIIEIRNDAQPSNLDLSFTDLNVDLGGIPLSLVRSYSSADVGTGQGDFGPGWSLSFLKAGVQVASFNQATNSLAEPMARGTRILVTLPDGSIQRFTFDPTPIPGSSQFQPYFRPDADVTSTLDVLGQSDSLLLLPLDPNAAADYQGTYVTANGNQDYAPYLFGSALVLRTQAGVEYLYDARSGALTAIKDDTGRQISVTQSADGLTTTIAGSSGNQSIVITRDANGRITGITDPNGQSLVYHYNVYASDGTAGSPSDTLGEVTFRDGTHVVYQYDGSRLTKIYDNAGVPVLTAEYDDTGHLKSLADASGHATNLTYQMSLGGGRTLYKVDDGSGSTIEEIRDNRGDVTRRIQALDDPQIVGPVLGRYLVTVYLYNMRGMETAESVPFVVTGDANRIDPNLDQTVTVWAKRMVYDSQGRITSSTDALGNVTGYGYDDQNHLIATTDPLGNVTHNVYDPSSGDLLETYLTQGANGQTKYNDTVYDYQWGQLTATYQVAQGGRRILVSSSTYDEDGRLATTTDASGVTTYYAYDDNGNQTATYHYWQDDPTSPTVYETLISRTDYDTQDRAIGTSEYEVTGTTAATGHITILSVGENPNEFYIAGQSDPVTYSPTSTTQTHYNERGQVDETVDRFGTQTWNVYDARGNVIETRTQAKGQSGSAGWLVTRTLYDGLGRVEFTTDPYFVLATDYPTSADIAWLGTRTVYDNLGRTIASQRYDGVTVELVADPNNPGQEATELPTGFDWSTGATLLSQTQTAYDDLGRVEYTTSESGARTDYYYDATNRQIAVLGPVETVDGVQQRLLSRSLFDPAGRLIQASTGVAVLSTTTNFAGHPNVLGGDAVDVESSHAATTYYEYDPAGRQTAVISTAVADPVHPGQMTHLRTETVYDSLGRRVAVRENLKQTDPFNPLTIDQGQVRETDYHYNDAGQLTSVVLPAVADPQNGNQLTNPTYTYGYDVYGDQTSTTDPLGRVTQFTFDADGHQVTHTLPIGVSTTSNPNDFVEKEFYNALGQLSYEISFEGVVTGYTYDDSAGAGGRLAEKSFYTNLTAYNGNSPSEIVIYGYDAFGRTVSVIDDTDGNLSTTADEQITTDAYDDEGRLVKVASPEGVIHYEYDEVTGLMVRTYTGLADDGHASTSNDGKAVTDTRYGYDNLGRLTSVTVVERNDVPLTTPEETDYRYDLAGNLEKEILPNGDVTDYIYDGMNLLTTERTYQDLNSNHVWDSAVDQLLAEYDYSLALDGKRTGVTETDATGQQTRIDWFYDSLGRLTREQYNAPGTASDFLTDYSYDLVGNRLAKKTDTDPTFSGTPSYDEEIDYTYDANDRLLTERKDAAGTDNDTFTVYEYGTDNAGTQQTSKTVHQGLDDTGAVVEKETYGYDLHGRMDSASVDADGDGSGAAVVSLYTYGDDGVRTSQTVGGVKTVYLYDSNNPTGYAQILEEKDASGSVTKTYTLGQDVIAQQAPAVENGATLYLAKDGHASTRALLNSSGQIVAGQIYAYDASGNEIGFDPANALTTIRYAGETIDSTGLSYNLNRYYRAATGTFTTFDSYVGNARDPQSLHKYLYCRGDSVNWHDPSGRDGDLGSLVTAIGIALNIESFGAHLYGTMTADTAQARWENAARAAMDVMFLAMPFVGPGAGPMARAAFSETAGIMQQQINSLSQLGLAASAIYGYMSTLAEALMGTNISYATSSQPSGGNEPQNFSDPATGKAAHDKFEDELVRQTNTRKGDWFMRTARGVNGVDATYRGPVGRNPGFKYAELKPYSQNGYDTFQKQMDNWRLPEGKTQLWFYDQQGNIFSSGINY